MDEVARLLQHGCELRRVAVCVELAESELLDVGHGVHHQRLAVLSHLRRVHRVGDEVNQDQRLRRVQLDQTCSGHSDHSRQQQQEAHTVKQQCEQHASERCIHCDRRAAASMCDLCAGEARQRLSLAPPAPCHECSAAIVYALTWLDLLFKLSWSARHGDWSEVSDGSHTQPTEQQQEAAAQNSGLTRSGRGAFRKGQKQQGLEHRTRSTAGGGAAWRCTPTSKNKDQNL